MASGLANLIRGFPMPDSSGRSSITNCNYMNLFCFILFFSNLSMASQVVSPSDFSALTSEEALRALNDAEGAQIRSAYVASSIKTRRLDLIRLCFQNQYAWNEVIEQTSATKDTTLRDTIVILMLKSESHYWSAFEMSSYGSRIGGPKIREPFLSVIKERLPGIEVNDALIETEESRLRLAAELEIAQNTSLEQDRKIIDPKLDSQSMSDLTGTALSSPDTSSSGSASLTKECRKNVDNSLSTASKQGRPWFWTVGMVVLSIVFLFILRTNGRQPQ